MERTGGESVSPAWRALAVGAGVTFLLAWVVGLALQPPGPSPDALAAEVARYAEQHARIALGRELLVHGLASFSLAAAILAVDRAPAWPVSNTAARVLVGAACAAAVLGLAQLACAALMVQVADSDDPSRAKQLFDAVNRVDGVKMLALALMTAMVLPPSRRGLFPRWFGAFGASAAASLLVSGAGYLFLESSLMTAAYVSLPALVIWVILYAVLGTRRRMSKAGPR